MLRLGRDLSKNKVQLWYRMVGSGNCFELNIPPCHNFSSTDTTSPLFIVYDSLKETVQMIVYRIIELLKGIKPFRKVRSDGWRPVVSQRALV